MKKLILAVSAASMLLGGAAAAETVKVGVVGPFSGPFALQGRNFQAGIEAYMALHGDTIGDDTVEIIYRDVPTPDPAQSAALSRELVVSEGVQYLAGYYFTPDALAAAPLLEQANVPMVIFNAATSSIVTESPYIVRTSFTLWQTTAPMARVAHDMGFESAITVVSDYGPGLDAEAAFTTTFEEEGGEVVDSIRMPISTTDFSPIMQRVKDSGAQVLFAFLPSGPPTLGFVKAYNDNGLEAAGVTMLATGDLTQESDLPVLGEAALGLRTTFHYSVAHDSPENEEFVAAASEALGDPALLSFPAVGAFDGMHVIYKMIEATGGEQDAAAAVDAVRGLAWESPRGPVEIDAETRHITQNIYLREVAQAEDGTYYNKEIQTFEMMGDPGLAIDE